jgi:hypothetical protein
VGWLDDEIGGLGVGKTKLLLTEFEFTVICQRRSVNSTVAYKGELDRLRSVKESTILGVFNVVKVVLRLVPRVLRLLGISRLMLMPGYDGSLGFFTYR